MWPGMLRQVNARTAVTAVAAATLLAGCHHASPSRPSPNGIVEIVVVTAAGDIVVGLDSAHAPLTVTNFLRYVDGGHFTGGRFHRTVTVANQPRDSVKITVIQGAARRTRPDSGFAPIGVEPTSVTGLRHMDGTISMARAGPNTNTSAFFIVIGNQPALDEGGARQPDGFGFSAFGRVTSGMSVVHHIHQSPHTDQNLTPAIPIIDIRRVRARHAMGTP